MSKIFLFPFRGREPPEAPVGWVICLKPGRCGTKPGLKLDMELWKIPVRYCSSLSVSSHSSLSIFYPVFLPFQLFAPSSGCSPQSYYYLEYPWLAFYLKRLLPSWLIPHNIASLLHVDILSSSSSSASEPLQQFFLWHINHIPSQVYFHVPCFIFFAKL